MTLCENTCRLLMPFVKGNTESNRFANGSIVILYCRPRPRGTMHLTLGTVRAVRIKTASPTPVSNTSASVWWTKPIQTAGTSSTVKMNDAATEAADGCLAFYLKMSQKSEIAMKNKVGTQNLVRVCTRTEIESLTGIYFPRLMRLSSTTCDLTLDFQFFRNGSWYNTFTQAANSYSQ